MTWHLGGATGQYAGAAIAEGAVTMSMVNRAVLNTNVRMLYTFYEHGLRDERFLGSRAIPLGEHFVYRKYAS